MKHLDLFSGVGGFALAARWMGWQTIGFAETDEFCSQVLAKHWPDVTNYGDVRNVPGIECDILTGGFPCQSVSVAGQRRGKADDRWLWPEMRDVIDRCRPACVVAENTPGLVTMGLDEVLADLEGIGYTTRPIIIPACAVDAPHRRDRVWIVSNSKGEFVGRPVRSWKGRSRSTNSIRWPAEPGICPLDDGLSERMARRERLRALGNAIVLQVAYEIFRALPTVDSRGHQATSVDNC